jgi:hypothetical protein
LYTDATCSSPYDDGEPSRRHSTKGYETSSGLISSEVSFRPPFYTCQTCSPDSVSETFNKRRWYDDDYINNNKGDNNNEADAKQGDDYFTDDAYLSANDDIYRNRRLDAMEADVILAEAIPADKEGLKVRGD